MVWIFPALHWTFRVLLIPKMCQLFPLAIYCEDNFCNCCNVRHIICCDMKSGIHFYTCVEWIWCVHGRYLFTLSICGTLWVVWCTNTALGRAAADLEHCVPHGYSPVSSEAYAEETWTWPAVNGYACYWLFSRSRWIACLLYVKMLEPKLEFPRVCRPLSRRLRLPSLLLVSLTAISCTVLPDLFTEWRHRSPHSHLAGAEGCDRTFTRLNGPAWPPQSTFGMQQPPTRLI